MQKLANGIKRPKRPRGRSSTAEILASANGHGPVPHKWAEHYDRLSELRDYLTGKQHSRTESAKAEPSLSGEHMAEAATDSYDRDWALAMASSDQNVLYEINGALSRIRAGTYGRCELTGKPIESARLRIIPWTRFCARAQAELENRGITNRTQLGKLGSYAHAAELERPAEEAAEELAVTASEEA